jgi:hypothetical protein
MNADIVQALVGAAMLLLMVYPTLARVLLSQAYLRAARSSTRIRRALALPD